MARLVLIGPPGAGKTSVGAALAAATGTRFVDVDAQIEQITGQRVADIFASRGESAFREIELDTTLKALADDTIVALGGGAVTQPAIAEALSVQPVVWLDVTPEEAARRVDAEPGQRPLLAQDPAARLVELDSQRRGLYARAAAWRIETSGRSVDDVAKAALDCLGMVERQAVVDVETDHPYRVVVASQALTGLAPQLAGAAKVAIIASPALADVVDRVRAEIVAAGAQPHLIEVPVGEAAKTPQVLAGCWSKLAAADFTRSDIVVGVGGGATTDFAGFLAASYLRGIPWVAVATSVLGMVDAAVGGKTGIDLPEGKNLAGAFWEPRAVLADLDTLVTLPSAEVAAGLAEVAKEGFTDDAKIIDLISGDPADALDVNSDRLAELIRRAVRVKARVVADDLRERTTADGADVGRERLNYGHTLAHAIEAHENFKWRHGEAVAVGCVFAAEVAHRVLGLPSAVVQRHRDVFSGLGLPTTYAHTSWDDLRPLMARDKKARGSSIRMVLLRDIGDVTVVKDPPEDALRDAFRAISGV